MPTHIFVTAAEGRLVPIPQSEASAPGATLLKCEPGKVYRLPYTTHTRRRINSGDLQLCDRGGKLVADAELAAAPTDAEKVETDETGAVVQPAPVATEPPKAKAPKFDTSDAKGA